MNCITGSNSLSGFYPEPGRANYFQAGLYVEHVPTGLWGMVDYGQLAESGALFYRANGSLIGTDILPDTTTWYFKAGLRERWTHLGHTVLYGEYLRNDDGNNINSIGQFTATTVNAAQVDAYNSTLHVWGLGVVQEIDAAAMSLWLSYRHLSLDDNLCGVSGFAGGGTVTGCSTGDVAGYKSFQYVKFGGLINF